MSAQKLSSKDQKYHVVCLSGTGLAWVGFRYWKAEGEIKVETRQIVKRGITLTTNVVIFKRQVYELLDITAGLHDRSLSFEAKTRNGGVRVFHTDTPTRRGLTKKAILRSAESMSGRNYFTNGSFV